MLKLILTSLSFSFIISGFSQRVTPSPETNGILPVLIPSSNQGNILAAFEGQPFKVKPSDGIEGDPLLFEDWKSGEVTLINKEKYFVDKINLDASNNKFIYSKNDTMFEFFNNVQEIKIYTANHLSDPASDMVFRSDVKTIAPNFVQVLSRGKITVYKEYVKKPKGENYSNGIVNITRKYVLQTTQNALVNDKIIPLKFNTSTLEELTADKKSEVEAYLKQNNLKPKREEEFVKAVNYYNSISAAGN